MPGAEITSMQATLARTLTLAPAPPAATGLARVLQLLPLPARSPDEAAERRRRAAGLYRIYGPGLYRRCRGLLRDPELAADATQEVFVRLLQRLDGGEDLRDPVAWLHRVAGNHCLNLLRDARGRTEGRGQLAEDAEPFPEPSPPGARQACDDGLLARAVLSRFDATTRSVAVGVLVEERELVEVAAAIGVSARTLGRKLRSFQVQARRFLAVGGAAGSSAAPAP